VIRISDYISKKSADFSSNLFDSSYVKKMTSSIMASRLFGRLRLKRVTIVIDEKTEKKLREIQGNIIASERKSYSFSKTVNTILLAGISQMPKITSNEWSQIRSFIDKKQFEFDPLDEKEYMETYNSARWNDRISSGL